MKIHASTKTLIVFLTALTLGPAAWSQNPSYGAGGQVADDYGALQQSSTSPRYRYVRDPNTPYGSKESVSPIVIEFSQGRLNSVGTIEEDLAVMTRIIDKALDGELGDEQAPVKAGIPMTLTSSGRSVRAMFVEGLGPLFMVKVNFPLLAPPVVEVKKPETKASSEWEKARKELRGGNGEDELRGAGVAGNAYSEEAVTALKKALLDALQQGANIRQLKPDDFIAISVFGSDGAATDRWRGGTRGGNAPASSRSSTRFGGNPFGAGGNPGVDSPRNTPSIINEQQSELPLQPGSPGSAKYAGGGTAPVVGGKDEAGETVRPGQNSRRIASSSLSSPGRDSGRGTVLTIRAKKADLDALAKGELTPDAFAKQATFHAYEGSGHGHASLNSWIQQGYPGRN